MKKNKLLTNRALFLLSITLILSAANNASSATGRAGKLYFKNDLGYSLPHGKVKLKTDAYHGWNTDTDSAEKPSVFHHSVKGESADSKNLKSFKVTAGFGYNITDKFRAEATFNYSKQNQKFNFPESAFANSPDDAIGDAYAQTIPSKELNDEEVTNKSLFLMANFYYDFNNCSDWTPFVNAGLGYGLYSRIFTHSILGDDRSKVKSKKGFSWDVGAGISYELHEGLHADASYKMTSIKRESKLKDQQRVDNGQAAAFIEARLPSISHSVNLGLRVEF